MKNTLLILGMMTCAGACLGAEMPPSASDLGCMNCHGLETKVVGPSWQDIAARYREKRHDPATLERLVKNVSSGSMDNWGKLPMTPSDPTGKKRKQIVEVVKYVLSLPPPAATQPAASQPAATGTGKAKTR